MNPTAKKWLTGCSIGCGAVVLLGILATVGGSLFLMGPFRDAIATRETLDEQFGGQDEYVPPADGAVAADRLEAFLTVREAIMALCPEFRETAAQFQHMEELGEDASKREAMGAGLKLTREVFGMVPRMGRLFEARNGTLAQVGMGLGEYSYIYVVAYTDQMEAVRHSDAAPFADAAYNGRIREVLRGMLRRQLTALAEAEAQGQDFGALRDQLVAEIALLGSDPERLPWQDGLPEALAASLAGQRERLAAAFCAETAGLELSQNRQRGLSIQSD